MIRVEINGIDFTNRVSNKETVEIELSFVEKITRELDEGSFIIPFSFRRKPFSLFDIVDVYNDNELIFSGIISQDDVNINSFSSNLYRHEIHVIEHTKILEKIFVNGKTFTQPTTSTFGQPYTLYDVVEQLRLTTPFELDALKGSFRFFKIPEALKEELEVIIAPEFNLKDLTLREALDEVFKFVDGKCRVDRDKNLILDKFNEIKDTVQIVEQSYSSSQNINYYGSTIVSDVINPVQPIKSPFFSSLESFPGKGLWTTLRSDNPLFGFEQSYIPTPKRIFEVDTLWNNSIVRVFKTPLDPITGNPSGASFQSFQQLLEIPIIDRVVEKQLYDSFDDESILSDDEFKIDKFFKENTIYYEYGKQNIRTGDVYGIFKVDTSLPLVLALSAVPILKSLNEIPFELDNVKEFDHTDNFRYEINVITDLGDFDVAKGQLLFRTDYVPMPSSMVVKVERDDISNHDFFTEIKGNQKTRVVDLSNMLDNLKSTVNRLGNNEQRVSYRFKNFSDALKLGDVTEEGYVVTEREIICLRDFFVGNFKLSKNFNKISEFMGLDQEIRQWEIGESGRTIERELSYNEYIEVDVGDSNSVGGLDTKGTLKTLEKFLQTVDDSVTDIDTITFGAIKTDSMENFAAVGVSKFSGGNAIGLNFNFEDNASISKRLELKEKAIFFEPDRFYTLPTRYTDNFGRFETMKFSVFDSEFYDSPSGTFEQVIEELLELANQSPVLGEQLPQTGELVDGEWYVAKDNREILKFTLMYHFLSSDIDKIIVGDAFIKNNAFLSRFSVPNVKIRLYQNVKFTFRDRYDVSQYTNFIEASTSAGNLDYTVDYVNGRIIINSVIPAQYSAWALLSQDNTPFFLVNSNDNVITFTHSNKRSGVKHLGLKPVFVELEGNTEASSQIDFTPYQALNLIANTVSSGEIEFTSYQALNLQGNTEASALLEFDTIILKVKTINANSNSVGSSVINFTEYQAFNLQSNTISSSELNFTANPILPANQIWVSDTSVASVWDVTVNLGLVSTCPTQQEGLSIIESNAPANNQDVGDRGRIVSAQDDGFGGFIPCTERRYRVELE